MKKLASMLPMSFYGTVDIVDDGNNKATVDDVDNVDVECQRRLKPLRTMLSKKSYSTIGLPILTFMAS